MNTQLASPTGQKPPINLDAVATLMAGVASLQHNDLAMTVDKNFLQQVGMVRLGLFRLVVMGEVKKGKSSFINALCGIRNLVPVHSEVATSTIFKIRYGLNLRYVVYFERTTTFSEDELGDVVAFSQQLCKTAARSFDRWLSGKLTPGTLSLMEQSIREPAKAAALKEALLKELNQLTEGPSIFDEQTFRGIQAGPDTLRLLAAKQLEIEQSKTDQAQADSPETKQSTADRHRLNKLLLLDAYAPFLSEKMVISPNELEKYGTEIGNPDNRRRVDFIAIEAPSPLLSSGLIIVDTPGVGGLFKRHRNITFKHAPQADAVFFVTDSVESPIGDEEIAFLKDLRAITNKIFFVQTKSAKVDAAAGQKRMENNLSILVNEAGFEKNDLRYFIVSSALKLDADDSRDLDYLKHSGFIPLMHYLNANLKAGLNATIAKVALHRLREKLGAAWPEINWKRKLIEADSTEKRAKLAEELKDADARLKQWVAVEVPRLRKDFGGELGGIIHDARQGLQLAIKPGGIISEDARATLDGMRTSERIYGSLGPLLSNAGAEASTCLVNTARKLEGRLQSLLEGYEMTLQSSMSDELGGVSMKGKIQKGVVKDLDASNDRAVKRMEDKSKEGHFMEHARSNIMSGTFFGTYGGILGGIAGGIGTLLCPGIGTVAGVGLVAAAASLFSFGCGVKVAHDSATRREADSARREVQAEIDRELGNVLSEANSQFEKLGKQRLAEAELALTEALTGLAHNLEIKKKGVETRGRETLEEIAKQTTAQLALETKAKRFTDQAELFATQLP